MKMNFVATQLKLDACFPKKRKCCSVQWWKIVFQKSHFGSIPKYKVSLCKTFKNMIYRNEAIKVTKKWKVICLSRIWMRVSFEGKSKKKLNEGSLCQLEHPANGLSKAKRKLCIFFRDSVENHRRFVWPGLKKTQKTT